VTRATSDGHTGRAARNAALRRLRRARERDAARDRRQLQLAAETASPAGSPEVTCRSPLQGGGGGCSEASLRPTGLPTSAAPFLPRYPGTNCAEPSPASPVQTGGQPTADARTFAITERGEWDLAVATATATFRDQRADHHRERARRARAERNRSGEQWHTQRACGQVERPHRVATCGSEEVSIRCNACAHEETQLVLRCGQWRLCRHCRARRAARYQAMFREGRTVLLAASAPLLSAGAIGGRWSERFLTLTLPHSGDIRRDIEALPNLWRRFQRLAQEHLRYGVGVPRQLAAFPFVRVLEVTPGRDLLGHAHIHAWLFSPYIPHELLRLWWGRALVNQGYSVPERSVAELLEEQPTPYRRRQLADAFVTRRGAAGRPLEVIPWPVVDVRACHGDVEQEFIKYLVKDAERTSGGALQFMDPALFARIYEGLEGIRTIQPSRSFWSRRALETGVRACAECGATALSTRRTRRNIDVAADKDDA